MPELAKRCLGDGVKQGPHIIPRDMFGSDARRSGGLNPYCRVCNASRQRKWKRENAEKVKSDKRAYRQRQKDLNDATC